MATELRPSEIQNIRRESWPAHRGKDFRAVQRQKDDEQTRRVICGFCGSQSGHLTGPEGRAWFTAHRCDQPNLRLVAP